MVGGITVAAYLKGRRDVIALVMLLWSEREYVGGAAEDCTSAPLDFRRGLVRLLGPVCGLWGTRNKKKGLC